jgi:cytochrome c oxidase subunit 2
LVLAMVMFGWGASLYFTNSRAPEGAMELHVVGKQWMWKIQHPEGPREINELHVPTGQAVRLIMTSEDVIHSFYIPAFRIKMDVLPGRYTTAWFEATQIGEYHLFCAEYCGNEHSRMVGKVVVMDPVDYERWVSGEGAGESMAARGARLFTEMRCDTCHQPEGTGRGPSLEGIFGSVVALENGQSVEADESYLRESILNPGAKVVAGFQPVMPTFQGQVNEEQLLQIIAYLKTLGRQEEGPPAAGPNRGAQPQ